MQLTDFKLTLPRFSAIFARTRRVFAVIRSMTVVLSRALLGVLDDRGVRIFAVSQATCIPVVELRRLLEFGSPLDPETATKLIGWAMRMAVVSKPKTRAPLPDPSLNGDPPREGMFTRSEGKLKVNTIPEEGGFPAQVLPT